MRWPALIALTLGFLSFAPAEDAAQAMRARVRTLVSQLSDAHNLALRIPGAELMALGAEALPILRDELAKPGLRWWTTTGLERAIIVLESRAAGQELDPYRRKVFASYQAKMLDRWRAIGAHNARWDADVEECLSCMAMEWSLHPKRKGDEVERARAACERALAAGCPDPYVTYLGGRLRWISDAWADDKATELMQKAAPGIIASGWDPIDKCFVLWRASLSIQWGWKWKPQGEQARQVEAWMSAIPALLVEAAKEPDCGVDSVLILADAYIEFMQMWKGRRVEAYHEIHDALEAALPKHPIAPLVCAEFSQAWAWDARGSGWANTVTDEGWRLMRERMDQANAAIALASERDPLCVQVPITALSLANGSSASSRDVIDWLQRAMAVHPGDVEALDNVTAYLEPKWNGSAEQLLDFGRHCLALGDWENGTPVILISVHKTLAHYGADGAWKGDADPAYWRQDDVWKDLDAVFSSWLKHRPDDVDARSQYLWFAHAAGKLDVARAQDRALHGHPRMGSVGGEKGYRAILADLVNGRPSAEEF